MPLTEDDCVFQAVAGDRGALTILLERLSPGVWERLAGEIPRRWQAVLTREDVMQETYTDAILDIHQLVACSEDGFFSWLLTIARRNLFDAVRMLEAEKRGGRRQRVEFGVNSSSAVALVELLGATSSTASRAAARNEAVGALDRAIEQLPENYRLVVRMYDLEDRPIAEVAKRLQRSEGAVFMLRARAHRRLSELMGSPSRHLSDSA